MVKPLLMSRDMVLATLAGLKSQTRRIDNSGMVGMINQSPERWSVNRDEQHDQFLFRCHSSDVNWTVRSNLKIGDVLYVRENWASVPATAFAKSIGVTQVLDCLKPGQCFIYRAGWERSASWTWKPSIHLPMRGSRIWLRITNVRIERLQDISEADCLEEGIRAGIWTAEQMGYSYGDRAPIFHTPRAAFAHLIDSVQGAHTYLENPWAWVYDFEVLSTTGMPQGLEVANG